MEPMQNNYTPGDFIVYSPTKTFDINLEIGVVKRVCDDGAFVAYHGGDTCAKTPFENMRHVHNEYAAKMLVQRAEQLGREFWELDEDVEDWST